MACFQRKFGNNHNRLGFGGFLKPGPLENGDMGLPYGKAINHPFLGLFSDPCKLRIQTIEDILMYPDSHAILFGIPFSILYALPKDLAATCGSAIPEHLRPSSGGSAAVSLPSRRSL